MARHYKFTNRQFKFLFEKILTKYQGSSSLLAIKSNASKFFGFRMYDPYPRKDKDGSTEYDPFVSERTLKKAMVEDPAVHEELKKKHYDNERSAINSANEFNGQNLYNKYDQIYKCGDSECRIQDPYANCYLIYAGYQNHEAFEMDFDDKKRPAQKEVVKVSYRGFVYSYRFNHIHPYTLEIDFIGDDEIEVTEHGFHDNHKEALYKGHAYILGSKMHIVLEKREGEELKDKMKIILDTGGNPKKSEVMRGLILATSSYQGEYPLSTETVVVRTDYNLETSQELRIKRYLFLHRYNIRVRTKSMNLDYVEAKNVSVDILSHMVGYYRVWRFDENYDIVQSMLHIGEEYQIYCYSNQYENKNYNKQVCLININKDDVPFPNKTICMTTHPKAGTGLIAHLMIKLLPVVIRKVRTLQENITGGVVCFAGREENGFPFKSAIVLLKEEDPASINNETFWKTIEKNQIKGEIGENAGLQILYEKLKELEIGNYDLFKELP